MEKATFEDRIKTASMRIFSIAPLLCAIAIAVWWLFFGMFKIYATSLTITERIGLTLCTVVIALAFCNFIAENGFKSAKGTEGYTKLTERWGKDIDESKNHKKEINEYAKDIAIHNIYDVRVENLEKNGLLYSEFFDENGYLINLNWKKNKSYTLHQKHIIKKCIALRVNIPEIFGNMSSKWFGIKKEETQKDYERKSGIKHGVVRLVLSLFSVGIMFQFLGFNKDAFFYALFQIVLWTCSGLLQRQKNYNFVMNKLKPQILEKCLVIESFLSLSDADKKVYQEKVVENEARKHRLLIAMNE